MKDTFGRDITYLRLSVTDLCNLRCVYCMPECGVPKLPHESILSVEEIGCIAECAGELGIRKIRLTGGEPLVRRGIVDIVKLVKSAPGIEEVALTTNAVLLPEMTERLVDAGLARVNISLDTLDEDDYRRITRGGELKDALAGIEAALDVGLTPLKINAVLMGGVSERTIKPLTELTRDKDIHVRFIEIMPIGECASWNKERFLPASFVTESIPDLEELDTDGVARRFKLPGAVGSVGVISPISSHFCPGCDKIRITSDGRLKPCLHSEREIELKGLSGDELKLAVREGIEGKPYKHSLDESPSEISKSKRGMSRIGG